MQKGYEKIKMCKENKDTTLQYYNQNAQSFVEGTIHADLTDTQNRFLSRLEPGATILDFGCGSGRDTKYFLEQGYQVEAVDGSEELCKIASEYTGIPVRQMYFQELDVRERYDGIWACSSILHLEKTELRSVLQKMANALCPGGWIYTSFKYGMFEGMRNGRYFTDFTWSSFQSFIRDIETLSIAESWVTGDVRPGREEEKWLNLMLQKR